MKSVITIGRDKRNSIVVSDLETSKKHAQIIWENLYFKNFFWLMDVRLHSLVSINHEKVGSQNGTFLNEQRLSESKKTSNEKDVHFCSCSYVTFKFPIYHGDYIKIGGITFVVAKVPGNLDLLNAK